MNITCTRLIYFSPTRTTKKILEGISEGLCLEVAEILDLTKPDKKTDVSDKILDELVGRYGNHRPGRLRQLFCMHKELSHWRQAHGRSGCIGVRKTFV